MSARKILPRVLLYAVVLLIVVWTLAPYAWLVFSSLSHKIDLVTVPLKINPLSLTFDNFRALFTIAGDESVNVTLFLNALKNSTIISLSTMLICLPLGVMGGLRSHPPEI